MERERAKEIVNIIVDRAKKEANEEGYDESAFALGYLKVFVEDCLCHLRESDYIVQLHLNQEG